MSDGFEVQQGGKFHAYVQCDDCSRPRMQGMNTNDEGNNQNSTDENGALQTDPNILENENSQNSGLNIYPNPSENGFTIDFPKANGDFIILNTKGKHIKEGKVLSKTIFIELPKGIYFVKWIYKNEVQNQKIISL